MDKTAEGSARKFWRLVGSSVLGVKRPERQMLYPKGTSFGVRLAGKRAKTKMALERWIGGEALVSHPLFYATAALAGYFSNGAPRPEKSSLIRKTASVNEDLACS
jgi:hypothetical protein